MSQQPSIDPRIKFYHVMHPDGCDGVTIGYRIEGAKVDFTIFEQSGYPKRGYNRRVGRMVTSGRLAKGKFQSIAIPEGTKTLPMVLRAAFNFWLTRNKNPLDMMYVRNLFALHYDKLCAADVFEGASNVIH